MQENSNLSVLVIDPNPGMRGSLQNMLVQAGIGKVEFAVSSGTAIRQLTRRPYDIILCEYDLSSASDDGQDGQQFLEDCRLHKLINEATIFIMLTSEGIYSKVVSAAELQPTDYILKPFTVDVLSQRIGRAIEKRNVFLPVYTLIAQNNLREGLRVCAAAEQTHTRYVADFQRLRAEMHVSLGEYSQAEAIYESKIAVRGSGWAHLGLARTLFAMERYHEAETLLIKLVSDNPKLMAAYDLLAKCHEINGMPNRAQKVLEEAVSISPHMVRRLRHLGEVALDTGDVTVAERSFRQVVGKSKYSEFRDPEDHVNLVKTLLKKGDTSVAGGIIRDMEKSLRSSNALDACRAISVAMLHESAGNAMAAVGELTTAVAAVRTTTGLSARLRIGLAQTCLANRMDREASEVMLAVMNDVDSGVTAQRAIGVFVKAGRSDLADGMDSHLKMQAQSLLNVAAEKTNMGDLKGAVQTLQEAMYISRGNVQVMLALAAAILRQLNELGWDHTLGELCHTQIDNARKRDADNPQIKTLNQDYLATQRKYGIST